MHNAITTACPLARAQAPIVVAQVSVVAALNPQLQHAITARRHDTSVAAPIIVIGIAIITGLKTNE